MDKGEYGNHTSHIHPCALPLSIFDAKFLTLNGNHFLLSFPLPQKAA